MSRYAIFASDLHGNMYAYEALFAAAEAEGIKTVILGGDLTPKWPVLTFLGGGAAPLIPHRFIPDANGKTYVDFLEWAQSQAVKGKRLEEHFLRLGGYRVFVQSRWTQKDLLAGQRVLRKILEWDERGPDVTCVLTHEDWKTLEPMLRAIPGLSVNHTFETRLAQARFMTQPIEARVEALRAEEAIRKAVTREIEKAAEDAQPWMRQQFLPMINGRVEEGIPWLRGAALRAAADHPLHPRGEYDDFDRSARPQEEFLTRVLSRRIRKYQKAVPSGTVYLILGNDDHEKCRPVVDRLVELGAVTDIMKKVVDLGNSVKLAGYPYVRDSHGRFYGAWEKPEEDIAADLAALEATAGPRTIYAVHTPPSNTALDQSFGPNTHYGSEGVRAWLEAGAKYAVLSGHIHEAPFVNGGVWREDVAGTPCMQPGGWHDMGVCAVVFNIDDPREARWIHDPSKIKQ